MAAKHKIKVEQTAIKVAEWLVENRTEFEESGIGEEKLASAVGISDPEVREAVDHLENREDLVRWPQALTSPFYSSPDECGPPAEIKSWQKSQPDRRAL
jgi:hypothetical protein